MRIPSIWAQQSQEPLVSKDTAAGLLEISIKQELSLRLSDGAQVILPDEDAFAEVNERYSNYKRPGYLAGVTVKTEQDVVEAVGFSLWSRVRSDTDIGRTGPLRTISRHTFRRPERWTCIDNIAWTHSRRHCHLHARSG